MKLTIVSAVSLFVALCGLMFLSACQGLSSSAPTYQLNVTAPATGSGTIASNPAGINCPGTCTASFSQNTQVTLTAAPAPNFTFTGWTGACSGTSPCAVMLSNNMTVGANFAAEFSLTVAVTGSGTVTSSPAGINCSSGSCSAGFAQNTQVTLTATPGSGDFFSGWSGACSGTSNCVVTVGGATNVSANFVGGDALTVNVNLGGAATGTVTSSPAGINCTTGSCSASFAPNTAVTLTATPGTSSVFNGWSGACTGTGDCSLTITAAATVNGAFNVSGTINSINHIIFFAQENRSFDHYFGYMRQYWANTGVADQAFDGLAQFNPPPNPANAPTNPGCGPSSSPDFCSASGGPPVPSFHAQSVCTEDTSPFWNEAHASWNFAFNYPNTTSWMDNGFVQAAANDAIGDNLQGNPTNDVHGYRAMEYFTDADLNYYYFMATQFATSDRWFAPAMTRTQANRAFIYAATSQGHVYPPGTTGDPSDAGQYSAVPIVQALQNAGISWRVYFPIDSDSPCYSETGDEQAECLIKLYGYVNEFDYEDTILSTAGQTPDLLQNIKPFSQFATDIQSESTFPSVVIIEPPSEMGLDEHPSDTDQYLVNIQDGANFVSDMINSFMTSAVWHDSAMIFTYDEWGGFFDHVQPQVVPVPNSPQGDSPYPVDLMPGDMCDGADQSSGICSFGMTGYRVPLVVISPYAKKNYVSHVVRDTTAWLNFVEERFNVPPLNSRDAYWSTTQSGSGTSFANAQLDEFFDYSNPPWMTPPSPPTQNTDGTCSDAAPHP